MKEYGLHFAYVSKLALSFPYDYWELFANGGLGVRQTPFDLANSGCRTD